MIFRKQKEISGHNGAVYTIVAQDNFIYSGSADKYIARWLIDKGIQDKFTIQFEFSIYSLKLKDNYLFAGLSNGALHVIDFEQRIECFSENLYSQGIFSIQVNTIKNHLYTGDSEGILVIRNLVDFKVELRLPLNCGKIRNITVTEDGNYLALACQDGNIRIFDTEFFNEIHLFKAHKDGVTSILFHPDNNLLISGGKDAHIRMWDWKKQLQLVSIPAHNQSIYSLIALENGKTLISASRDKSIKIWRTNDLTFIQKLDLKEGGHRHSVNMVAKISENEFASCSDDKKIIVWEKN